MKPVYVCSECLRTYKAKDMFNGIFGYSGEHGLITSGGSKETCKGKPQPYFAASDIEKLINGRIEQHKKNILESDQCIHMDYIQAEMLQCMALEKLLSALEEGEK